MWLTDMYWHQEEKTAVGLPLLLSEGARWRLHLLLPPSTTTSTTGLLGLDTSQLTRTQLGGKAELRWLQMV